jgi:hypothetical protein
LVEAGFARIQILWRSPPPEEDLLDEAPLDGDEARASKARRLNRLLFAPRDYALIATR